jgi:uncharacterized phiE125 gp8 family phage protein
MKPPYLVTAPTTPIVTLFDMKEYLRVTHNLENTMIEGLITAATAYLDGWKGILGRAVVSQKWREEYDGFGDLRLSLPDVVSIVVTATDFAGGVVTVTQSDLKQDVGGHYVVTAGGNAETVAVEYIVAMPAQQVATVAMIVKLLVAHWYENREAASASGAMVVPMSAQMLIESMRWSLM